MSLAVFTDPCWKGLKLIAEPVHENPSRKSRILAALGLNRGGLSQFDEENLARYFEYLSRELSFPFQAHYPQPRTPAERDEYACTVLGLLDPRKYASDEFSGIYCKTEKGGFEVNLPLLELEVPEDGPNFQLVEDYCHWFWNWR